MKLDIKKANILNALHSASTDHVTAVAEDVFDENYNAANDGEYQSTINKDHKDRIASLEEKPDPILTNATQSAAGLMSASDKIKLDGVQAGAQVNSITGVKGDAESAYRTGNVNITKTNIGLGNVDNTSDASKPVSTAQATAIADAKKAGTDAASALNTYKTENNAAVGKVASDLAAETSRATGAEKAIQDSVTAEASARATAIANAVNALDATVTSTDGKNIQVKVTEVDGKVTAVNITKDETAKNSDLTAEINRAKTAEADAKKAGTDAQAAINTHAANTNIHVPTNGVKGQTLMFDGDKPVWGNVEVTELSTYGVSWRPDVADPHLARIGSPNMHKTLPIQSNIKGCIFNCKTKQVVYWLNAEDWRLPVEGTTSFYYETFEVGEDTLTLNGVSDFTDADIRAERYIYESNTKTLGMITSLEGDIITVKVLTPETLDTVRDNLAEGYGFKFMKGPSLNGFDGEVMVYFPEFWIKSVDTDNERSVSLSTSAVDQSWEYSPELYVAAYRCTVLNTVPENMGYLSSLDVNSAISVMNTADYCRGGGNRTANDTYLSTDAFRTDLGKPRSDLSRATMRTYSRTGGKEVLSYNQYKNLYWLWVIEYANFNSQEAFNPELTEDGYHQGGMGTGLTNLTYTGWNAYNEYYSICPCGITNQFGNGVGVVPIETRFERITPGNATYKNANNYGRATQTFSEDGMSVHITSVNATITIATWTSQTTGPRVYKVTGLKGAESITIANTKIEEDGEYTIALRADQMYYITANFGHACDITIEQVGGSVLSYSWASCTKTFTDGKVNITAISYSNNLYYWAKTTIAGLAKFSVSGLQDGQRVTIKGNNITEDGEYEFDLGTNFEWVMTGVNFAGPCDITITLVEQTPNVVVPNNISTQAVRWRGIENPFGDLWQNLDGIIIDANADAEGRNNMDLVYISTNPEDYNDSDISKYQLAGRALHTDGYIKEWALGGNAHIIPRLVGGGSTTYKSDYRYSGDKNTSLNTLIVGGDAFHNALAGLGCFDSDCGVSDSYAYFGFRSVSSVS